MQYLGRLYDNDPDNIQAIQELHKILLANKTDYDVNSIMESVCLTTKHRPHLPITVLLLLEFSFNLLTLS
jgi:hypothetical protein